MKLFSRFNHTRHEARADRTSMGSARTLFDKKLRPLARSMIFRVETGFVVTVQSIYYILLLFMFFAIVYDIGNAGYVATISTNSVRVAAQDAAKHIDEVTFINTQEVRLSPDALGRAQDVVDGMTGGRVAILQVKVTSLQKRDVIMILGHAHARLPIMGVVFGLTDVLIPVEAYAEPAYGISLEGQ